MHTKHFLADKDSYRKYNWSKEDKLEILRAYTFKNQPISGLIEDILEKDLEESYFIQLCDFISYFVHLYYKVTIKREDLPNRVGKLIDKKFVGRVLETLKNLGNLI